MRFRRLLQRNLQPWKFANQPLSTIFRRITKKRVLGSLRNFVAGVSVERSSKRFEGKFTIMLVSWSDFPEVHTFLYIQRFYRRVVGKNVKFEGIRLINY